MNTVRVIIFFQLINYQLAQDREKLKYVKKLIDFFNLIIASSAKLKKLSVFTVDSAFLVDVFSG